MEHFSKYFNEVGLKELSDFMRVQQSQGTRKELQKELQERLSQDCPIREVQYHMPSPAVVLLNKHQYSCIVPYPVFPTPHWSVFTSGLGYISKNNTFRSPQDNGQ